MQKLAHAAYAVALVSVMAISAGPANAQASADDFYELACIDSAGLCYTGDGAVDPIDVDEPVYVNAYRPYANSVRYTNMYRPYDNDIRYTNMYRPSSVNGGGVYVPYSSPLAPGLFGLALDNALANYPDTGTNTYSNRYIDDQALVIDDNVAACEARYRSYDASTGMYLGYDGNYHPCRL